VARKYDLSGGMHPPDHGRTSLTVGLAMLTGLGLILMVGAGTIGVIHAQSANTDLINLLFAGGVALFISGIVAWAAVTRPWEHYDNIEIPVDDGHGHHHDEAHTETH
jgi:hypothetical protein